MRPGPYLRWRCSVTYTCDGALYKRMAGQLYAACWEPNGGAGEGRGIWVWVPKDSSEDTAAWLREHFGDDEYERHFDAGGPDDVSVDAGGTVWISLEDDSVRELRERADDPTALAFSWTDYPSSARSSAARSRKRSTFASLMSS